MNEPRDMFERRLGQNAMPEIEDEGACAERARIASPRAGQELRRRRREDRIEIALHRDERLQLVLDPAERLARVAAYRIDARLLA